MKNKTIIFTDIRYLYLYECDIHKVDKKLRNIYFFHIIYFPSKMFVLSLSHFYTSQLLQFIWKINNLSVIIIISC